MNPRGSLLRRLTSLLVGGLLVGPWVQALAAPGPADPIHMVPAYRGVAANATHLMLPMRDGVPLWTSVYFPKNMGKSAPAILLRTPYQFDGEAALAKPLLERGYVVALQNERGRF